MAQVEPLPLVQPTIDLADALQPQVDGLGVPRFQKRQPTIQRGRQRKG